MEFAPLIKSILTLIEILGLAWALLTPGGQKALIETIELLVQGVVKAAATVVPKLRADITAAAHVVREALQSEDTKKLRGLLQGDFADLARSGYSAVSDGLLAKGAATPEKWKDNAATAMADAFGFGLASFGVTTAFEAVLPRKLNTLNGMGPMLATLAGFDHVTRAALTPLLRAAVEAPATAELNSKFRSRQLEALSAAILYSRRLITAARFRQLVAYAGVPTADEDAVVAGAFRPVSPFVLGRIVDDTEVDFDRLRDTARYIGYRDQDIELLIEGFKKQAVKSLRAGALTAAITNYREGLMDDAELASSLEALGLSEEARELVELRARQDRLRVLTTDYKRGWDSLVNDGAISTEAYRLALVGLGYKQPILDALVGLAENKRTARVALDEAALLKRTILKTEVVALEAAMAAFAKGDIAEAGLLAALLAIGLTPELAAAYVALAKVRKEPKPKPRK